MGIDTKSGNLTDFAGGVTKGETVVEGGLRELEEESLGIFGHLTKYDVENTISFHCHNMITMFIELNVDMDNVSFNFREKIKNIEEPEVCDIVWLETKDFLESVHGRRYTKLYIRVRRLLNQVTSTIEEL